MFSDILTFLSTNTTHVFAMLGNVFGGATSLIYDSEGVTPGLTKTGEVLLFGLIMGMAFFGINFIVKLVKSSVAKKG